LAVSAAHISEANDAESDFLHDGEWRQRVGAVNPEGGEGEAAAAAAVRLFFSGWFDLFDGRGRSGRARVLGPPASENPY
jgi:hypothetical protein